jgi:sugar transferase (PEP-CTERM system associated)
MIRLFNHYFSIRLMLLTLVEALVLFNSVAVGGLIRYPGDTRDGAVESAFVFTFVMLATMTALGMYHRNHDTVRQTVQRLVIAFALSAVLMSAIFYVFPSTYVGRGIFALASVFAMGGVLLVRLLFFHVTRFGILRRKVMIVGHGDAVTELIDFMNLPESRRTMAFAGLYSTLPENDDRRERRAVDYSDLPATVRSLDADEVVIAARERRGGVLPLRELLDCKLRGVRVLDMVSFYERERGVLNIDDLRASWLIFGEGFSQGLFRDIVKRIFDIVVASTMLVLALPVMLIAMLAVVIETGRPALFRQERVGEGGGTFMIIKLRSMRQSAEKEGAPQWAGTDDPRITRVGRLIRALRIDELPQLVNVLRGDMSFVGPRPERPFFVEQLERQIPYYDMRHSVKPGLTGWAQVRFRYGASVEDSAEKLQYDLYYVKNHSLFLDLMILLETVQVVLTGKGAR